MIQRQQDQQGGNNITQSFKKDIHTSPIIGSNQLNSNASFNDQILKKAIKNKPSLRSISPSGNSLFPQASPPTTNSLPPQVSSPLLPRVLLSSTTITSSASQITPLLPSLNSSSPRVLPPQPPPRTPPSPPPPQIPTSLSPRVRPLPPPPPPPPPLRKPESEVPSNDSTQQFSQVSHPKKPPPKPQRKPELNYSKIATDNSAQRGSSPPPTTNISPSKPCNVLPSTLEREDNFLTNDHGSQNKPRIVPEIDNRTINQFYTAEELCVSVENLPPGVDPQHRELYLHQDHFQTLFNLTKEQFFKLPKWKQSNMKKQVGLY